MTQKISSSRDEFEKKMLELYKLKSGYWPAKSWFEAVEQAQQPLRQRLGGVRLVLPVSIDNAEMPAPIRDVEPLYKELRKLVGSALFDSKKLTLESFQFANTTIPSQDPRIKPRKMGVGKVVSHHVEKASPPYDQETRKAIDKTLSQLGVIWARARQEKYKLFVNVTTSPLAFACIGHYGPDQNSCFGQCRENFTHKLGIGVHPNSAVILMSEEELEDGVIYHPSYVARWFMFTKPDFSQVNTFNYYPRGGIVEGNMLFAMRKMAERIIGQTELEVAKNKFFIDGIYHNNRGGPLHMNFTYDKNAANLNDWRMKISPIAYGHTQCPKCRLRTFTPDDDGEMIDSVRMCPHCVRHAQVCDVTGTKSYNLVNAYDNNDKLIRICKAVAKDCTACYDGYLRLLKKEEFGLYRYYGSRNVHATRMADPVDGFRQVCVPNRHIDGGRVLVNGDTMRFPDEGVDEKTPTIKEKRETIKDPKRKILSDNNAHYVSSYQTWKELHDYRLGVISSDDTW